MRVFVFVCVCVWMRAPYSACSCYACKWHCTDGVSIIFAVDIIFNFFFTFEVGDGDFKVTERRNSVIAVHYMKVCSVEAQPHAITTWRSAWKWSVRAVCACVCTQITPHCYASGAPDVDAAGCDICHSL